MCTVSPAASGKSVSAAVRLYAPTVILNDPDARVIAVSLYALAEMSTAPASIQRQPTILTQTIATHNILRIFLTPLFSNYQLIENPSASVVSQLSRSISSKLKF